MQYLSRSLQAREQFMINKRARSRKMLQMSVLTVHKNQKQECQHPKLQKMSGLEVKDRKNIGNVMRILQQMPSTGYNILKNMKSKLDVNLNQSVGYDTFYKTHNKTLSSRPFTDLRKKSEQSINYSKPRNISMKRLLRKLYKNKTKSSSGFLMSKEDFADPKISYNRRKHSEQENLSVSLSCKLAPYSNSNLLSKYTVRKSLNNNPSQSNPSKNEWKKQQYPIRYGQNRKVIFNGEEELAGWQMNMGSKQGNSMNFCSFQPLQL